MSALPIIGVLSLSLSNPSPSATISLHGGLHFDNFVYAWRMGSFGAAYKTSAIIAIMTVLITAVVSLPAGYAFALMKFKGRQVIFYVVVLGLVIPYEAVIVPLYFDMRSVGLINNYSSVILPDAATSVAFGVFWMRAFFLSVPRELLDAAKVDGASSLQTLLRVLIPLSRPYVLTLSVLVFTWTWNDFLMPLVMLAGANISTVPLSLVLFQGQHITTFSFLGAASIIAALPVIAVFMMLQRSFVRGLMSGAIKA